MQLPATTATSYTLKATTLNIPPDCKGVDGTFPCVCTGPVHFCQMRRNASCTCFRGKMRLNKKNSQKLQDAIQLHHGPIPKCAVRKNSCKTAGNPVWEHILAGGMQFHWGS